MMIQDHCKRNLVAAARAAVTKAYLTKEGGVRYGAAALTASGQIFSAGQYSSYNHTTNVHAEQATLLVATMNGDPDVVALAVASTGRDFVTRPCGVCRQVMLEHATRTGRDFLVLMADREDGWEEQTVSALLPFSWTAASQQFSGAAATVRPRSAPPKGGHSWQTGTQLHAGDQLLLQNGVVAVVWDPCPWQNQILVKIKYQPKAEGFWHKLSHSFTESMAYERELLSVNGLERAPCGAPVACIRTGQIERVYPTTPVGDLPPVLSRGVENAGLSPANVRLGGSRSTGMNEPGSDVDLVVRAWPAQAATLRRHLATALLAGTVTIPASSGTWRMLNDLYPGGRSGILAAHAFAETFEEQGRAYALMLCPPQAAVPIHGSDSCFEGHGAVQGHVIDASLALQKRASILLRQADGSQCEVVSFHKAANLIRNGDRVAARGWRVRDQDRLLLLQFHPHRDNLVWLTSMSAPSVK